MNEKKKPNVAAIVLGVVAGLLAIALAVTLAVTFLKHKPAPKIETASDEIASAAAATAAPAETTTAASNSKQRTETTAAQRTEPAAANGYLEPSDRELAALGNDFYAYQLLDTLNRTFLLYDRNDPSHILIDFDPANADAEARMFTYHVCPLYAFLFGEPDTVEVDDIDPVFGGRCVAYDAEKLNFVAENVLNAKPLDFTRMTADSINGTFVRYENGVVCAGVYPFGATDGITARVAGRERLADGSFRFTIEYESWSSGEDPAPVDGTGELIAALKSTDGTPYWSILSYKADLRVR